MTHFVQISIGSNSENAKLNVTEALEFISALLSDVSMSGLYTTPCMGNPLAPHYTNAVAAGSSHFSPSQLVTILKAYETIHGREHIKHAPVAIDLDLVTCNGSVLRQRDFNAAHFTTGIQQIKHEQ